MHTWSRAPCNPAHHRRSAPGGAVCASLSLLKVNPTQVKTMPSPTPPPSFPGCTAPLLCRARRSVWKAVSGGRLTPFFRCSTLWTGSVNCTTQSPHFSFLLSRTEPPYTCWVWLCSPGLCLRHRVPAPDEPLPGPHNHPRHGGPRPLSALCTPTRQHPRGRCPQNVFGL